jgi:hypothetical protein
MVVAVRGPGAPVSQPWWQIEAWKYEEGSFQWMTQSWAFSQKTEEHYLRFVHDREQCRSTTEDKYKFVYTGNTNTGSITYGLNFEDMTQTNQRTGEKLRIRRVAIVLLDGPVH